MKKCKLDLTAPRVDSYTQAAVTEKCGKVQNCVTKCNTFSFKSQNHTRPQCGYGRKLLVSRGAERLSCNGYSHTAAEPGNSKKILYFPHNPHNTIPQQRGLLV